MFILYLILYKFYLFCFLSVQYIYYIFLSPLNIYCSVSIYPKMCPKKIIGIFGSSFVKYAQAKPIAVPIGWP